MSYEIIVKQIRESAQLFKCRILVSKKPLIIVYSRFSRPRCIIRAVEGTQNRCVNVYISGRDLNYPSHFFMSECMYSSSRETTLNGWLMITRFDRFNSSIRTLKELVVPYGD